MLPFPYTNQRGAKRRPVVVPSTDAYNARRADLIVAPITSNLATGQADDTALLDWAQAGLLKPSVVKGLLGSIAALLVTRRIGKISERDLKAVEKSFVAALGL